MSEIPAIQAWKEGFNTAVLKFLQTEMGKSDAREVTNLTTGTETRGYCDTCSYDVTIIEITYTDTEGKSRYASWEGNLADFITAL
jgi:hypothetical protein